MGSDELVERLRQLAVQIDPLLLGGPDARLLNEAADEIERLTAQLAEARESERAAVGVWLRAGAGKNVQNLDRSTKALFLRGLHSYADAIEAGEHA